MHTALARPRITCGDLLWGAGRPLSRLHRRELLRVGPRLDRLDEVGQRIAVVLAPDHPRARALTEGDEILAIIPPDVPGEGVRRGPAVCMGRHREEDAPARLQEPDP